MMKHTRSKPAILFLASLSLLVKREEKLTLGKFVAY
jgi:hypothetical protein